MLGLLHAAQNLNRSMSLSRRPFRQILYQVLQTQQTQPRLGPRAFFNTASQLEDQTSLGTLLATP